MDMQDKQMEYVRQAAKELNEANIHLQKAFLSWSESVTNMHFSELTLREAQTRLSKAYLLLKTTLNHQLEDGLPPTIKPLPAERGEDENPR